MRASVLILASLLAAGHAAAQSIQTINGSTGTNGSVVVLSCNHCPPLQPPAKTFGYVVPTADPGSDHTEIRQIDGKMKIVSTEAYHGGSPVVFITTAGAEDIKAARADIPLPVAPSQTASVASDPPTPSVAEHTRPAIDADAKTSGIATASMGEPERPSQEIDTGNFQLRLN